MISPPAGVNFTAFDRRLSMICLSARRSPRMREAGADIGDDLDVLRFRLRRDDADRLVDQSSRTRLSRSSAMPAGLDARHVENVVDDAEEVGAAVVDVLAVLGVLGRAERTEHPRLHDLREADDGVERRAQFVADIGEELRLGAVGLLGAVLLLGIFARRVRPSAGPAARASGATGGGRRWSPSAGARRRSACPRGA